MDERDFNRRNENRVVHYKKIDSICQKTGIVSRGIELSSIVELQNLDKIGKNNLSEVDPSVWLKREEELRGQYKLKEALDLINLVLKVKPKLKEAYYYKYQILLFGNLRGEIRDDEVIECMYAVLNNSQKEFYILDRDSKDMDYEIYVNLGDRLSNISDYENAIKAFNNAISLFPDYISAWDLKADCLSKQGKHDAAIYYYDKAINILKIKVVDSTGYRSRLADDLIHKGICLKRLKRYDSAIDLYKEALEINPNQDRAWEYIGLALEEQGKNKEANQYYKKEIANSKWAYQAWHNLSHSLSEMGKYEEALNAVNEGLKIKPDYSLLLVSKVRILVNLMKFDEALEATHEYQRHCPNDGNVVKLKEEVLSTAIASFDRDLTYNAEDIVALENKGLALIHLKSYEEAIIVLKQALDIDPKCAGALSSMGNALGVLERHEEAIEYIDRALAIDPDDFVPWYNKGLSLRNLKRYEEALEAFDHALTLNPKEAVAWYNKGLALLNLKRYEEAIAAFNRTLSLNPDAAIAWKNKGIAYENLKRFEEADAAYKCALEIDPNMKISQGK